MADDDEPLTASTSTLRSAWVDDMVADEVIARAEELAAQARNAKPRKEAAGTAA
jgi:hypothetical protein